MPRVSSARLDAMVESWWDASEELERETNRYDAMNHSVTPNTAFTKLPILYQETVALISKHRSVINRYEALIRIKRTAITSRYTDELQSLIERYRQRLTVLKATAELYDLQRHTCRGCLRRGNDAAHSKKACSGCKEVFYCSPECQKANWKAHKPECKHCKKK